jgi:Flp pilus assembly protein TadG
VLRLRKDKGAALVETAFLAPFLILLALGIADLGRVLFIYINVHEAAQEGAMFAAYGPYEPSGGLTFTEQVEQRIRDNYPDGTPAFNCPLVKGNDQFTVTVTQDVDFITPLSSMFGGTITLTGEVNGEIFLGECR